LPNEKLSEAKLNQLEDKVNSLKEEKIRTEEQLKNLRNQKDEIIAELATLGVTPKTLDNVIHTLETEIRTKLTEVGEQIPKDMV